MIMFRQAIKRIFQNKLRLLILLIMPLLFILMFAMQDDRSLTIGVVDKDNSSLSKDLADTLEKMDKVKVKLLDEKALYDRTVSYQVDYSIIIEQGFEKALAEGKNPEVKEFYINEKEKLFYARMSIENYILNMKLLAGGTGFDKAAFDTAQEKYKDGRLVLANESVIDEKVQQGRFAMGFLVQFMLYMSVITAGLILEDKSSGVLYRVFYAPVTLKRYLAENLTAFLSVGIMQVTLILLLLKFVFGLKFGSNPLNLYLLLIVFALVCVSIGMWLVSIFKKPIYAYMTIVFAATPLVMLGGCYWPMDYMPDILQKIARFLPTFWAMQGVDKLLYDGKNIAGIGMEILVLIIFSGIFMASGLFKKVDISR